MISFNRVWAWVSPYSRMTLPMRRPQTTTVVKKDKLQDFMPLQGISEFRGVLADRYRKASESQTILAVIFLDLPNCASAEQREIAKFLLCKTISDTTVFLPSESCLAMILPDIASELAVLVSLAVMEVLNRNYPQASIKLNLAIYPDTVKTLEEFEAAAPWVTTEARKAESEDM